MHVHACCTHRYVCVHKCAVCACVLSLCVVVRVCVHVYLCIGQRSTSGCENEQDFMETVNLFCWRTNPNRDYH